MLDRNSRKEDEEENEDEDEAVHIGQQCQNCRQTESQDLIREYGNATYSL